MDAQELPNYRPQPKLRKPTPAAGDRVQPPSEVAAEKAELEADVSGVLRLTPQTYFTLERFALIVGMSVEEVRKRIYRKAIPAVRGFRSGQWLISADLLREQLEGRARRARLGLIGERGGVPSEEPIEPGSARDYMAKRAERRARRNGADPMAP